LYNVLAGAYIVSATNALTLVISITVALLPLLIASTAATVWKLVRRRRDIRFGRRELLITVVGSAAGIVVAVAIGVAGLYLTS
jgi:hypothetical protein